MLTHILHNSEQVCAFIDQLDLDLSQPQRRHLLNLVDALLVCESRKRCRPIHPPCRSTPVM